MEKTSEVYYRLADIRLRMICDFEYRKEYSYMKDYLTESGEYDYEFEFRQIRDINVWLKKMVKFTGQTANFYYYLDAEGREYCFHSNGGNLLYAVTVIGERKGYCYYISQGMLANQVNRGNHLENLFCLEKIFQNFGCMVLHSCHIHWRDKAILFSAPSGTGKSTQGELWRQYADAQVINGDRTALRKKDGVWTAYGVPFCGTSGINENRAAPLRCIAVIRQAPFNRVSHLSGREIFYCLYSELTVHTGDPRFIDKTIGWIENLAAEVPVCLLECTKDREAVDVLKDFIENIDQRRT